MSVSDLLEDARLIELQPGDVIVIEASQHAVSRSAADEIKRRVAEVLPGRVCLVLGQCSLKVVRG